MRSTWRTRMTKLAGVVLALAVFALPAGAITPTQVQKLLAADGASEDLFGFSVAVSGDTAVIGAS